MTLRTIAVLSLAVVAACNSNADDDGTGIADETSAATSLSATSAATEVSSTAASVGDDGPAPTTGVDTGTPDTEGGGSSDTGSTGDAPLGPPVPVPVTEHCTGVGAGPLPPPNPDLTRTLPGSTWDATGGCIVDAYEFDWPGVTMLGIDGEITTRFAFDDSATTDLAVVLDYTEQIEIDREGFYYVPADCDEVLRRLLGTSAEYTTHPVHPGYVSDASSCAALEGTMCSCTLVTHYVEDHVNEGFTYIEGNAGVALSGGRLMQFEIADGRMSLPFIDQGSPGVVETLQAVIELELQ